MKKARKKQLPAPKAGKSAGQRAQVEQPEDANMLRPVLRFTPTAWAKLQFFCHRGDTEIGGFGVARGTDLLLIEDLVTVKQKVTCVSVAFDDEAVADFFEQQVDLDRKPNQFARLWLHTHPGGSPEPSCVDEETFSRVFGNCDWAAMVIVARNGKTFARLRFNIGPKGDILIPVMVDYTVPFEASNHEAWEQEYAANIRPEPLTAAAIGRGVAEQWDREAWLEDLDPAVEQEELELLARTQDMSPDELEDLFENEVMI